MRLYPYVVLTLTDDQDVRKLSPDLRRFKLAENTFPCHGALQSYQALLRNSFNAGEKGIDEYQRHGDIIAELPRRCLMAAHPVIKLETLLKA